MRFWSRLVVAFLVVASACGDDSSGEDSSAEDSAGEDTAEEGGGAAGSAGAVEDISIEVEDLTFDALAAGPEDGETVLLLHGFPQTSQAYEAQVAALGEAGYRAIAPDQRGYSPGARPTEVEDYRIPELVGDVVGMADALEVDQFHLVGHDWGGMVAWHVAGREPDRLLSLTVLSTPHPEPYVAALGDPEGEQQTMSTYIDLLQAEDSEHTLLDPAEPFSLWTIYEASGMPEGAEEPYVEAFDSPEAMAGAVNWYKAVDGSILDGLGPVTAPTLYVWSTDDVALGRTAAEATGDHVDGEYCFVELEGVSHWIPEEEPEQLTTLLLDHLAGDRC